MQHWVWIATAPISFPYSAAFERALDSLEHGASVGQLVAKLLFRIFCVAGLVQLWVIVEADRPAWAGIAFALPQRSQFFI